MFYILDLRWQCIGKALKNTALATESARRVSLIREANQEDRLGEVDGRFFLRGECRVHRLMGRFPRAIALLLAYASAATATSPYSLRATQ